MQPNTSSATTSSATSGSAMASQAKNHRDNGAMPNPLNFDLSKAVAMPKNLFQAHLTTGLELLAFASRRLAAHAELVKGIGHCGTLDDASRLQGEFFTRASEEYSCEVNQLMDIARENFSRVADLVDEPKGERAGGTQH